jgi:hypothetical protein
MRPGDSIAGDRHPVVQPKEPRWRQSDRRLLFLDPLSKKPQKKL